MNATLPTVFAICVCIAACGDQADGEGHAGDTTQPAAAEFEGCPDSIPKFSLGMSTTSENGSIKAKLLKASPTPPARFFNDWTVEFTDADDTPLDDVNLRSARAFMPVHGHYGTPDPRLTQHESEPAKFDLDALNLFMRGPWQIKLGVGLPGTDQAELIFDVCVEE